MGPSTGRFIRTFTTLFSFIWDELFFLHDVWEVSARFYTTKFEMVVRSFVTMLRPTLFFPTRPLLIQSALFPFPPIISSNHPPVSTLSATCSPLQGAPLGNVRFYDIPFVSDFQPGYRLVISFVHERPFRNCTTPLISIWAFENF